MRLNSSSEARRECLPAKSILEAALALAIPRLTGCGLYSSSIAFSYSSRLRNEPSGFLEGSIFLGGYVGRIYKYHNIKILQNQKYENNIILQY
jgi:hypothetical protein